MSARLRLVANVWQGIYTTDFTLDQVRRRCYRLGEILRERAWSCLIAYDTRFMSNLFARDISAGLAQQGIAASLAPAPAPLPAVQLALDQRRANCALVVSARNRPYWFNGLVLLGPLNETEILRLHDYPLTLQPFPPTGDTTPPAQPADQPPDLRGPYLEMLRGRIDIELVRRSTLTMFVDPMNGTTIGYIPALISDSGQTRAIEINRETDPLFGKLTPLPAEAGLTRLRKLVRESDSHIGLAFSADGTALGVIDKNGDQLDHLEIALLLAAYLARQHRQRGMVVAPLPAAGSPLASKLAGLGAWEDAMGLKVELSPDANARIAELLAQEKPNLLLGCTQEGELVLGRFALYPDALLAGLLLVEMIARNGGNFRVLIDELREHLKAD